MSRLRGIVAKRMTESLKIAAQLTQVVEIDVTTLGRLRETHKASFRQREGVNLTYLPFFVKATAEVPHRHPSLNASLNQEADPITYHDHEHIIQKVVEALTALREEIQAAPNI